MNIKLSTTRSTHVLIDGVYSGIIHPSHKEGYAYLWITYERGLIRHHHTIAEVKSQLAEILDVDEHAIEVYKQ